jgi:hypothetical protein
MIAGAAEARKTLPKIAAKVHKIFITASSGCLNCENS